MRRKGKREMKDMSETLLGVYKCNSLSQRQCGELFAYFPAVNLLPDKSLLFSSCVP